jgi:hypothetical protein
VLVVPVELAVIEMELPPVAAKLALDANPEAANPCPMMELVAVILPAVVNAAVTLIPFPPFVPP